LGVGTSHGHLNTQDSPRPGLRGSHHLLPYSILCSSERRLHPNGFFSRDSQGGVPKLSWFGLPGLWAFITSRPELGSRRALNQTCSSRQELSNAMSHFCCRRREEVDSRLFVVGSQIASLIPGSFAHNLGCRCPNGQCEVSLDIYASTPFQWYQTTPMRGVLALQLELWIFGSPGGLQVPTFGSVGFTLTLSPKWGCDKKCCNYAITNLSQPYFGRVRGWFPHSQNGDLGVCYDSWKFRVRLQGSKHLASWRSLYHWKAIKV
jgi:hypothetical protein